MVVIRDLETHEQYTTEEGALYCFDFSKFSEVQAGATISNPVTPAVSGLTFGTPEVITATFTEYKQDGTTRTVASGKGVKVRITPDSVSGASPREIACTVDESGGGKLTVKALWQTPS
jgi:hypothetical protein